MFSQTQNSQSSEYGRKNSQLPASNQIAPDKRKPLILLVEDDTDSCNMLRTLLQLWEFCVIEARDGEQAVVLARDKSPDLILMDVKIPGVDGIEATRRIREFASSDDLPVVFVSGFVKPGFSLTALAAGGNDFLVKPLDFKELEEILDKYIRKKESAERTTFQ